MHSGNRPCRQTAGGTARAALHRRAEFTPRAEACRDWEVPAPLRLKRRLTRLMTATLLFDLDGTLTETDHLHFEAFKRVLRPRGVDVDWETYRTRIIGRHNPTVALEFLPHVPVEHHAGIMDSKEAAYRDLIGDLEPAAGLVALLDWAKAARIPCGVVTNAPRPNAELVLGALGLDTRFKVLVIGPELDDAKPHPLPYLTGLEALGGDPALSVAFEDSPSGAASAKAAGLAVAGLLTSLDAKVLQDAGAELTARDFTDPALLDFVRRRTAGAAGRASLAAPGSVQRDFSEG
jgi:HAD superfamily hydrolase (TIGR01509 family)